MTHNDEKIEAIETRWSLIRNAHDPHQAQTAEEARRSLVIRYMAAIRRYVGAIVANDVEADDLAQDFAIRMMKGDFAGADPNRGRFRDLLKTAIRNMVKNHWAKANRHRASDADLERIDDASSSQQDAEWTAAWRKSVLDQTWARMLADDGGKPSPGYLMLKLRVLMPDASSEELADTLSQQIGSPVKADAGRQILRRARARFAAHLLDEIKAGLSDESDERVEEDLAELGLLEWFKV